jgi:beta-glucuronidase
MHSGAQTNWIATYGRKTVSLDGQWQTIIDPYETGYYDYRYQPRPMVLKTRNAKTKSDLINTT